MVVYTIHASYVHVLTNVIRLCYLAHSFLSLTSIYVYFTVFIYRHCTSYILSMCILQAETLYLSLDVEIPLNYQVPLSDVCF